MDNDLEEVTLPVVSQPEPSLPSAPPFIKHNVRKRPFLRSREPSSFEDQLADAINTSSDPALFSSDDTPDADNYSGGVKRRKKRTYEGTWWGGKLGIKRVGPASTADDTTGKRQFRRNFDSGIFMADDSSATDLSSESSLERELLDAQEREQTGKYGSTSRVPSDPGLPKSKVNRPFTFATEAALKCLPQGPPSNPQDHLIQKVVHDCLDTNNENVDWTGMGLDNLPSTITDLKSMIKRIYPGSVDNSLAPFEAELKVYLGNNDFTHLPLPLFELTNIQLLSVRQNKLTEIPPGIRSLTNLQELNIASNNLQYLPFETLELLWHKSLKTIHSSPNPWIPLPAVADRLANTPPLAVIRLHSIGVRRFAVSKPIELLPNGGHRQSTNTSCAMNRQPHLSEMVLRSLLRHNSSRAALSSYLSEDHSQSVRKLLDMLHSAQLSGGRVCTFCNRDIVLPRYQWFEWWDVLHDIGRAVSLARWQIDVPQAFRPGRSMEGISYVDTSSGINQHDEVSETLKERLLPFQRTACGCVDVITGLEREAQDLSQSLLPS